MQNKEISNISMSIQLFSIISFFFIFIFVLCFYITTRIDMKEINQASYEQISTIVNIVNNSPEIRKLIDESMIDNKISSEEYREIVLLVDNERKEKFKLIIIEAIK